MEKTEMMIRRFNELAGGPQPFIKSNDLKGRKMMEVITQTVSSYFSSTISSSSRVNEDKRAKKEVVIDYSLPNWDFICLEKVHKYSMMVPDLVNGIQGFLDKDNDKCINDFPDDYNPNVKVAQLPFAKGSMRAASYGVLIGVDGNQRLVVIKESLSTSISFLTKSRYENYLLCLYAGKIFANQFNEVKPVNCAKIEFCEASILQFMTRQGQPHLIMESFIRDKFEKYNNNNARNPTNEGVNHDAVQAFSHWTYCISEAQMMIVDCQGGFNEAANTFILTDPAVHHADVAQFGSTNMGGLGFRGFFSNHVCNRVCASMKLPPVAVAISS